MVRCWGHVHPVGGPGGHPGETMSLGWVRVRPEELDAVVGEMEVLGSDKQRKMDEMRDFSEMTDFSCSCHEDSCCSFSTLAPVVGVSGGHFCPHPLTEPLKG